MRRHVVTHDTTRYRCGTSGVMHLYPLELLLELVAAPLLKTLVTEVSHIHSNRGVSYLLIELVAAPLLTITHLATHCDRSCRVTQHGMTHLALCTYPLKLLRAPTPWHHRPRIAPRSSIRRPSPPPSKEQLESLGQPRQTWSIIPDVSEWVP